MVALKIDIREEDKDIVLGFLKSSQLIRAIEILENSPKPHYDPTQVDFSFEDIEAIVAQFPPDKKWTYSEAFEVFPPDLKVKLEILNNQLTIMPAPSILHQKISNRLSNRFTNFVEENVLGEILVAPTDVKFDEDNVAQPDILFVAIKRSEIMENHAITGAPDLVVEIISPSNDVKEMKAKRTLYESKGVEEYWTIFPEQRQAKVEVLTEGQYKTFSEAQKEGVLKSSVLEGFQIDIENLIPDRFFE